MKKLLILSIGLCLMLFGCSSRQEQVSFNLHATTFDYGESITSVTFEIKDVDPTTISKSTFKVIASSKLPDQISGDENNYGLYSDVQRTVESVEVNDNTVEIKFHCENGQSGEGTLNYAAPNINKNMDMDITYTILQEEAYVAGGQEIAPGTTKFVQNGTYDNPEVEAFQTAVQNGMSYYYYVPENADDGQKHPLIVWLHGYGEGGYDGVSSTNSTLRANRAAVCFTQEDAQEIFQGAFVVAPQAPTSWIEDLFDENYDETILSIVDQMAADYAIDVDRVYLTGASSGGYGALWMASKYPERWAAVVPICPGIASENIETRGGQELTDEDIMVLSQLPVWTIQAANDPSVPVDESSRRIFQLLNDTAIYTEYPTVNVDGVEYNGHWSWIYFAHNMPNNGEMDIWTWMASNSKE